MEFDGEECTGEEEPECESLSLSLLENILTRFFTEGNLAKTWSFNGRLFGISESESSEEYLLLPLVSDGMGDDLVSVPTIVGFELVGTTGS